MELVFIKLRVNMKILDRRVCTYSLFLFPFLHSFLFVYKHTLSSFIIEVWVNEGDYFGKAIAQPDTFGILQSFFETMHPTRS
jgi:hypothetical protein